MQWALVAIAVSLCVLAARAFAIIVRLARSPTREVSLAGAQVVQWGMLGHRLGCWDAGWLKGKRHAS